MFLRDLQLFLPLSLLVPVALSAAPCEPKPCIERKPFSFDCCEQHFSILGEALFLKRAGVDGQRLIQQTVNGVENSTLDVKTLEKDSGFQPGYRVGASWLIDKKSSLEGQFFQIDEWSARDVDEGNANLSFPFNNPTLTQDFVDADQASASYATSLYNAELNFWRHITPKDENYASGSALVGFRYIGIDETLKIAFTTPPDTSNYNLHTKNRLSAAQIGVYGQFNPTENFFWELTVKVGGFLNEASQRQSVKDLNNTVVVGGGSGRVWKGGFLAEGDFNMGYHFSRYVNIHAGYMALFLTNLALAPDQINLTSSGTNHVTTEGDQVYHGFFTGLLLSF
jgi:hypothetical protein